MATYTYFKATLAGQARKQFTCIACGCVYQATVERTAAANGGLQAIARERAARQLAERLKTAADCRPCPTCGLVPPNAVARRTEYVHGGVWLGATFVAAVIGGLGIADVLPFPATAAAVGGVAVLSILIHLVTAATNPNRRRDANLERAQADLASGAVDVIQPGQPGTGPEPRSWTTRHTLGILLASMAPLIFIAPAHFRTTVDLQSNPSLQPSIVAIGVPFSANLPPPTFQSVGGRWSASPKIRVLNAVAVHAPATLPATSLAEPIGEKLQVDKNDTNHAPTDLFVNTTIPDDPALDGQTLQLRATLTVVYPVRTSKSEFEQKVTTVTQDFPVVLTKKADYQKFYGAWGGALLVFAVLTITGGGLLCWGIAAVKKQGVPAELVGLDSGVTP